MSAKARRRTVAKRSSSHSTCGAAKAAAGGARERGEAVLHAQLAGRGVAAQLGAMTRARRARHDPAQPEDRDEVALRLELDRAGRHDALDHRAVGVDAALEPRPAGVAMDGRVACVVVGVDEPRRRPVDAQLVAADVPAVVHPHAVGAAPGAVAGDDGEDVAVLDDEAVGEIGHRAVRLTPRRTGSRLRRA